MSRLLVPRTLAAGSLVSATTAFRVGAGNIGLAARRGPRLIRLAGGAFAGRSGAPAAQAAFRDELIGLASESAELSWRELRRGVDDLDWLTRPRDAATITAPRPYRVKP
jgi:hypothetical protein